MGRFIHEQLLREGVYEREVKSPSERLTAPVIPGIREHKQLPLIS